jgi:hypothetical protein
MAATNKICGDKSKLLIRRLRDNNVSTIGLADQRKPVLGLAIFGERCMLEKKISNPLTLYVVGIGIGNLHTAWATYASGTVNFFNAFAWLQAIGFFFLYFRKSKIAASYFFYSALLFLTLYYGLKAIELNPPPIHGTTYLFMAIINMLILVTLWRLRRKYNEYLKTIDKGSIGAGLCE